MSPTEPTDRPASGAARPRPRGPVRRALLVLGAGLLTLGLLLAALYFARRDAAREVLVGWLQRQGVEAEVEFERFDLNGLVGRIRAGPADDPDLVVERVEVDYALGGPWSGGWSVTPSRIRLVRPEVKARLVEGRIEFGSLDGIVRNVLNRPPQPDRGAPVVEIEQARVRLITRVGELRALGDGRLEDGRLVRLDAVVPAARLRDEGVAVDIDGAAVSVRTVGGRMVAAARALIPAWRTPGLSLDDADLHLQTRSVYPDAAGRETGGPLRLEATLAAGALTLEGLSARAARLEAAFDGRAAGWLEAFEMQGRGRADLRAGAFEGGGLDAGDAVARVEAADFRLRRGEAGVAWRLDGAAEARAGRLDAGGAAARGLSLDFQRLTAGAGEAGMEAVSRITLAADQLRSGDLSLGAATGAFDLDARFGGDAVVALDGGLRADRAAWTALGAPREGDVPEFAAVKRALGDFRLDAPGLALRAGDPGVILALTQPMRATPATGGTVTVTARPGRPLYAAPAGRPGGGAFDVVTAGGGLPQAQVSASAWTMAGGTITAELDGQAGFDFGLARAATLDAAGILRIGGGTTTFAARECALFTAERLELGENDVTDVSARLCGGEGPLLTIADGWRMQAAAREVGATAGFLGLRFTDAAGPLNAADRGRGLQAEARVDRARVTDTNDPPRFRPMGATGRVTLADDTWRGAFRLGDAVHDRRLADLTLTHSGRTGAGELLVDATNLRFEEGGLQPSHISPLADAVAKSDAVGQADFTGAFRWTPEGVTSGGRFHTDSLSFISPAGAVTSLAGTVELTSLAPVETAPGQTLRVAQIDSFLPLSQAEVVFQLAGDVLRIAGGDVRAAGGVVRLEPLDLPLDPDASYEGVLVLEEVQLNDLMARTGFGHSVDLDARVSGRLPFIAGPGGVTFIEGHLAAVRPGRISIAREALAGVEADGGGEEAPPGLVEDFAYQAMENLAFEELSATVNSLPEGRLGVLFRVRGRHDPPQRQEIRLTLMELIRREFMDDQLPLPSGTEIDLTLDTTFNLDQLVGDLMEINRARQGRSGAVQGESR